MPAILIIIISIVALIFFHELGHFLVAKKYGVRVEEFGIGIPPRVFGKKIGETLYSLNLIPLGGFVRLYGEDKKIDDERSFSSKPLYQRALIVFAGVAAFFVIAFLVFSVYSVFGVRTLVTEEEVEKGMYDNWEVVVAQIVDDSPADKAGIRPFDVLATIDGEKITKGSEAVYFLKEKKGEEVEIEVFRGEEKISFSLTPREEYGEGEGPTGLAMAMTTQERFSIYEAPIQGLLMTGETTIMVLHGFGLALRSALTDIPLPEGMDVGGPVAIVDIGTGAFSRGAADYLEFLGMITISLAIINILPIPALDGGRLVFLGIEKIKGGPLPEKVEYGLNGAFLILLLSLMVFITIRDLGNIGVSINFF